ncbi:MAG: sugar phosphate isomerase/epimerase family protein [Desulfobacterales bacterium]
MFKNLMPFALGIRAPMLDVLELVKTTGFEGMDLSLGEAKQLADEHSVAYVKSLFDEAGVKLGAWGMPVNWRAKDAEYQEHLAGLPESAKLAADLGCHQTITAVMGGDNHRPFKENWDFHVKRLRPAAEILNDYGHSLAVEFIGPEKSRQAFKYGFLYTMDATLALCAAIGTGNVGLCFDVWHNYTSHTTLDDVKKLSKEDVVYVHINDAPAGIEIADQNDLLRALPGETGIIPLVETLRFLDDIGYDGPVAPEPFSPKLKGLSAEESIRTTMETLDKVWKEAGLA